MASRITQLSVLLTIIGLCGCSHPQYAQEHCFVSVQQQTLKTLIPCNDQVIVKAITHKLKDHPRLAKETIQVSSYRGVVTLSGQLPDRKLMLEAVELVYDHKGVSFVIVDITFADDAPKTPPIKSYSASL